MLGIRYFNVADLSSDGTGEIIITYSKTVDNVKLYYSLVYKISECHYLGCTYEEYLLV